MGPMNDDRSELRMTVREAVSEALEQRHHQRQQIESLRRDNSKLEETVDYLGTQLHKSNSECIRLSEQAQSDRAARDDYRERWQERGKRIATLESELQAQQGIQSKMDAVSKIADARLKRMDELRAKADARQIEINQLRGELTPAHERVEALRRLAHDRLHAIGALQKKTRDLEYLIEQEEKRRVAAEDAHVAASTRNSQLRADLSAAMEQNAELRQLSAKLRNELHDVDIRRAKLEEEKAELTERIEASNNDRVEHIIKLANERDDLNADNINLNIELARAHALLAEQMTDKAPDFEGGEGEVKVDAPTGIAKFLREGKSVKLEGGGCAIVAQRMTVPATSDDRDRFDVQDGHEYTLGMITCDCDGDWLFRPAPHGGRAMPLSTAELTHVMVVMRELEAS